MKSMIYLQPEAFEKQRNEACEPVSSRPYVLDEGIAIIASLFIYDDNIYWTDKIKCSSLKQVQLNKISNYDLHKELALKLNLDESLRERTI